MFVPFAPFSSNGYLREREREWERERVREYLRNTIIIPIRITVRRRSAWKTILALVRQFDRCASVHIASPAMSPLPFDYRYFSTSFLLSLTHTLLILSEISSRIIPCYQTSYTLDSNFDCWVGFQTHSIRLLLLSASPIPHVLAPSRKGLVKRYPIVSIGPLLLLPHNFFRYFFLVFA